MFGMTLHEIEAMGIGFTYENLIPYDLMKVGRALHGITEFIWNFMYGSEFTDDEIDYYFEEVILD